MDSVTNGHFILSCFFDVCLVAGLSYLYFIYYRVKKFQDYKIDQIGDFTRQDLEADTVGISYFLPIMMLILFGLLFNFCIYGWRVEGNLYYLHFKDYWFILSFCLFIFRFKLAYMVDVNWCEFDFRKSLLYMKTKYQLDYDKYYNLCKEHELKIFPMFLFDNGFKDRKKGNKDRTDEDIVKEILTEFEKQLINIVKYERMKEKYIKWSIENDRILEKKL